MYPKGYTTGDEYDSPCDRYGCGFASHDPRCTHYTAPRRPQTQAEIEAELNTLVDCLLCGKTVRFREVQQNACCNACQADLTATGQSGKGKRWI